MTTRIAVLASGGGSNLQALLDYHHELGDRRHGEVVLVASNRASAPALDRARTHGTAAEVLSDPADGSAVGDLLSSYGVDLVVLAGYLKLVPREVVSRWSDRIVNVHPALLPSFGGSGMYGMRVHEAVLASGVRISGPTVHLVDEEYDRGRILAQWPVPVLQGDTPESLAARVLRAEHMLLPRVVESLALAMSRAAYSTAETSCAESGVATPDAPPAGSFHFTPHDAPGAASMDAFLGHPPIRSC
jgi:phosphoribosylglycinamide formyltransferase-1